MNKARYKTLNMVVKRLSALPSDFTIYYQHDADQDKCHSLTVFHHGVPIETFTVPNFTDLYNEVDSFINARETASHLERPVAPTL